MMRKSRSILLGALLALTGTASADEQYQACVDATVKNDEWAQCGGDLIKREEAAERRLAAADGFDRGRYDQRAQG
jgi:hypothetical protein